MNDSRAIGKGSMIAGKYKLLEKIGRGTFGQVFKVQNVKNGELLAAKIETKTANNDGLIVREIKILKELHNYEGFPKLIFYGKDDYHNYLIQTLCWSNLEELLTKCKRKFSIRTISHIAI